MKTNNQIPPEVYNKAYLLSDCLEGYQEYLTNKLSAVKKKQIEMLHLEKGTTLLEVGYGRGELLYHCAKKGAEVTGIDYSKDAFEIASKLFTEFHNTDIRIADCRKLPFNDNTFQRVFSGDVIEHLCYEDATIMLKEMHRVLQPGGIMLVHTTPNTVFTRWVYPLIKPILLMIHKESVHAINDHLNIMKKVHIGEHNIWSLNRIAKAAKLNDYKIWIDSDIMRSNQHRHTKQLSNNFLIKLTGALGKYDVVKFFMGNDIYLKSYKS